MKSRNLQRKLGLLWAVISITTLGNAQSNQVVHQRKDSIADKKKQQAIQRQYIEIRAINDSLEMQKMELDSLKIKAIQYKSNQQKSKSVKPSKPKTE